MVKLKTQFVGRASCVINCCWLWQLCDDVVLDFWPAKGDGVVLVHVNALHVSSLHLLFTFVNTHHPSSVIRHSLLLGKLY